ncbi:VOC family protein [candidate division WOR-3 bacterium]|nr:VOC family protein [candidate division WOR-3 bacterium]
MMQTNHIAILVRNLESVSKSLPPACILHAPEEQPAEGTRERYVTFGGENVPALLLIQAIADGPYSRALEKRGPGLHHIGCVCGDIEKEVSRCSILGLLLHPISLLTRKYGVVWLCRPGVPYLVELMENPEQSEILFDKETIRLPAGTRIPPFAVKLSSNLTIATGDIQKIAITAGAIEVSIDPSEV